MMKVKTDLCLNSGGQSMLDQFFVAFYRLHVETKDPLTNDLLIWTFDATDGAAYRAAVQEIKKADHLHFVSDGGTINKSQEQEQELPAA